MLQHDELYVEEKGNSCRDTLPEIRLHRSRSMLWQDALELCSSSIGDQVLHSVDHDFEAERAPMPVNWRRGCRYS